MVEISLAVCGDSDGVYNTNPGLFFLNSERLEGLSSSHGSLYPRCFIIRLNPSLYLTADNKIKGIFSSLFVGSASILKSWYC